MYNLLVSGNDDAWKGTSYGLPAARCLKPEEYSDAKLTHEFGQLKPEHISLLCQLPAIFACETGCNRPAQIGRLTHIQRRGSDLRLQFQLLAAYPAISNTDLMKLKWELGIEDSEFSRTHWALKDESLSQALLQLGLPQLPFSDQPLVNIHDHTFDVALSFPGEIRGYVETVAKLLVRSLGHNRVFYDNFYKSQLAIPNLDIALQSLYRKRARLVVAFLSKDFAQKKWCGIEFRAIRDIINEKHDQMVMFVRHDSADIAGVFSHDGYIDANKHSENEIAAMIHERVLLLQ